MRYPIKIWTRLFLFSATLSGGAVSGAEVKVDVSADRAGGLYELSDRAEFRILAVRDSVPLREGTCRIRISDENGGMLQEQDYDLSKENPVRIKAGRSTPGFLWCRVVKLNHQEFGWQKSVASAGFAVRRIRPGMDEPSDFDAFWGALLKRQRSIPDAVSCEVLPDSAGVPGYRYYKLTIRTVDGGTAYGYLGVPKQGKKFPALISVCGAGPGYDRPDPTFVRPDMMTLSFNLHGFDPARLEKESKNIYDPNYFFRNSHDRDRYYFRSGILGLVAAVDWLTARKDFNGRDLVYLGASQGGFMGLVLAALHPKVSAAAIGVPAMCDHSGADRDHGSGWPGLVKQALAERREAVKKASAYYDGAFFAKRIRCPVLFTVGFIDSTCRPSSVYSAYNQIRSPKSILAGVRESHVVPYEHLNGMWQWIQNALPEEHRGTLKYYNYF